MFFQTWWMMAFQRLGEFCYGTDTGGAPMAASFDKNYLDLVQNSFARVQMKPADTFFLGSILGIVTALLMGYLLRHNYKKLHYHLLAMFAGKKRLEDNRRILEHLAKAESPLEVHQGDGKNARYLSEGKIEEVGPAGFVLKVMGNSANMRFPVGKMLMFLFRPIQFKDRQFNHFNTYLERVSQPGSREYLLHFQMPMSLNYLLRRNHSRYEVERQSFIKGKLWLERWEDGRSRLRLLGPSLRINMDKAGDAWVHDISAGGIRLVLPEGARPQAYKQGKDMCLQLFLFNPAKGNYRWIWLGATVTKVFTSGKGLNLCMRFAALGSVVNAEESEMRWADIGVAEGLPGMNRVIDEWEQYLAGRQEKDQEALV
ncbi:hypothetical protein PCS_02482 [Desulfocurvibacter africanus PCS]|uniref:PilZ domain-containing protein n=1 Tax=Desulfocurvibacter africanus PCS TaxID=1262666 RepID=M5Q0K9_DESAF|nr:hypothetical protein [Desulfocurvibacter africanus]EMG36786.1 hypothetical protein PCS_02482 [Desulfocurvibacter africanus PCS]